MLVQLITDNHIEGREELATKVEAEVATTLDRFASQITRVEVHLSDENSHKNAVADKKCNLEVRVAGLQPIVVSHLADTLDEAVAGALTKMERSLDHTLGKLSDRKGRTPFGGEPEI